MNACQGKGHAPRRSVSSVLDYPFCVADLVNEGSPSASGCSWKILSPSGFRGPRRVGRSGLSASGCPTDLREKRGCGLRCGLSWLEIRCDRCRHRYAGRSCSQPPQGACTDQAYPCRERNGDALDLYGSDAANPPPLPNVEWNLVPSEQVHISVRVQECNWLQAVEGEIRLRPRALLHGRLDAQGTTSAWIQKRDLRPTFECVKRDFGMSIGCPAQLRRQHAVLGASISSCCRSIRSFRPCRHSPI